MTGKCEQDEASSQAASSCLSKQEGSSADGAWVSLAESMPCGIPKAAVLELFDLRMLFTLKDY